MTELEERVKHPESRDKVVSAQVAAGFFKNGMLVATSGSTMGFPKATFGALAERMKAEGGLKIDLLCAGPLSSEFEDVLYAAGGIRKRIGSVGGEKLRGGINRGEVAFVEGKGSVLPLQVKRGLFGHLDLAVVEAVGLTTDGRIIPSTAVYDAPEWIEAAAGVIIEINLKRPLSLEGLHDVSFREEGPVPIDAANPLARVGVPFFPVDPVKIRAIVFSAEEDKPSREPRADQAGAIIGEHLTAFFHKEITARRLTRRLPPLELGFGELFGNMMERIGQGGFDKFRFHLPMISDPVFELITVGKVEWAAGIALRLSGQSWKKFEEEPEHYKKFIVLRPLTVNGGAEMIQRLGTVAINGCLEMDLLGQVNSSHVLGSRIMAGIGGTYDYSRNSLYSIFVARSTTREGAISSIVPRVSHVDHTMHDVDVLVTEQGLADLRSLTPQERAREIIAKCAHPDYRAALTEFLRQAEEEPSHIPLDLAEAGAFHRRLKVSGSMKA